MNRCLLVGAGAELGKPACLAGGNEYVWQTCYSKNDDLYKALRAFYDGRLSKSTEGDSEMSPLPSSYEARFLFQPTNREFKDLVEAIARADRSPNREQKGLLDRILQTGNPNGSVGLSAIDKFYRIIDGKEKDDDYAAEVYRSAYRALIHTSSELHSLPTEAKEVLNLIPQDAYFGIIEGYFSALLSPRKRSQSFWKLVNYFWTAFFSIAGPLVRQAYEDNPGFIEEGLYSFTLNHLQEVVGRISSNSLYDPNDWNGSYYQVLSGCFDSVLTTNYTGLSERLFSEGAYDEERCVYLAGTLWRFESPLTLRTKDIRREGISDDEFLFPYLLTQVPVKPIIDWYEVSEYSRAIKALEDADVLIVLGYSFCENDTHIRSLVAHYVEEGKKLIYAQYGHNKTDPDIASLLHVDTSKADIQVVSHEGPESLRNCIAEWL